MAKKVVASRPPSDRCPFFFTPFLVGRSGGPAEIDYRQKFGHPYSNLSAGGPSCEWSGLAISERRLIIRAFVA